MKKYVVFLRGINVGGNAAINMAALKTALTDNGYGNVETYLNSGNVIVGTDSDKRETEESIEQIIEKYFKQKIAVFAASQDDLEYIVNNNPFDPVAEPDNSKRMVVLFMEPIADATPMTVYKDEKEDADYYLMSNLLYIYYKVGAGRAKITNPTIKQLLKQTSTSRNWNTITKMLEKIR